MNGIIKVCYIECTFILCKHIKSLCIYIYVYTYIVKEEVTQQVVTEVDGLYLATLWEETGYLYFPVLSRATLKQTPIVKCRLLPYCTLPFASDMISFPCAAALLKVGLNDLTPTLSFRSLRLNSSVTIDTDSSDCNSEFQSLFIKDFKVSLSPFARWSTRAYPLPTSPVFFLPIVAMFQIWPFPLLV